MQSKSLPDLRPPKSPRRFFAFTPIVIPALPSLPAGLVRSKSDAAYTPSSPTSSFSSSPVPGRDSLRAGAGVEIVRTPAEALRGLRRSKAGSERTRPSLPPLKHTVPFAATLLSSPRVMGTGDVLVKVQFAYTLDERTPSITLPLSVLRRGGGYLVEWVEERLRGEMEAPDMTDGESAESEYEDEDEFVGALLK